MSDRSFTSRLILFTIFTGVAVRGLRFVLPDRGNSDYRGLHRKASCWPRFWPAAPSLPIPEGVTELGRLAIKCSRLPMWLNLYYKQRHDKLVDITSRRSRARPRFVTSSVPVAAASPSVGSHERCLRQLRPLSSVSRSPLMMPVTGSEKPFVLIVESGRCRPVAVADGSGGLLSRPEAADAILPTSSPARAWAHDGRRLFRRKIITSAGTLEGGQGAAQAVNRLAVPYEGVG